MSEHASPLRTTPLSKGSALLGGAFFQQSTPPVRQNHAATVATPQNTENEPLAEEQPPKPTSLAPSRPISKIDLLAMVGNYEEGSVDDYLQIIRDPYMRGYAPADEPRLVASKQPHDVNYPSLDEVAPQDDHVKQLIWNLRFAVVSRLRSPLRSDLDSIYDLYRRIPEPRMSHIHATLRHQLLRVLSGPDKKDFKSMVRYFAVVSDVKNSGLLLTLPEWNGAISFASRYVGTSTEVEAQSALKLWRELEHDAGIKGNEVTFNILFDVASKAGNFVLAEMIYKEMEERGYPFNRYHHVSLIHFFGLRKDSDGLRAAYRDMVNSGEIIDTVTLNCVIAGLLRCGEEDGAERVYERMRDMDPRSAGIPHRSWMSNKAITKVLMMFSRLGRRHPDMQATFQGLAPLSPDLSTYRILVNHTATKLGDLGKVTKYLEEMKYLDIPTHGSIFLALFKGFHFHGGYPGSAWSEQRLKNVWNALIRALDDDSHSIDIRTWMVIWALKAFDKCSTPGNVREVYDQLAERWDLLAGEEQFVDSFFAKLMDQR